MVLYMVGQVVFMTLMFAVYVAIAVILLVFWQQHWYLAVLLEVVWLGMYCVWVRYVLFPVRKIAQTEE